MFKSKRVLLRPFRREDMERQWAFENDPDLWFWDGHTPAPAKLESLLAHFDDNKSDNDDVSFAIEIGKKYVGHCGLHTFDEVNHTCELSVEIGDSAYWGKGSGREIVKLLLQYGFDHRHAHRVWLKTHSENERAIRCYKACGFVEEGRLRQHLWLNGRYVDRVIMGILREGFST